MYFRAFKFRTVQKYINNKIFTIYGIINILTICSQFQQNCSKREPFAQAAQKTNLEALKIFDSTLSAQ